jgi:nitroreductase
MTTLDQLLAERYSCRAFLPEPVPADTISEVLTLAQRTASWCNTQAWQVHLTSGEGTARFAKGLTEYAETHEARSDFDVPDEYVGVYKQRRRDTGHALYRSLGIAREDYAGRAAHSMKNFALFGAPHTAVITTDRRHGVYGAIDCGGYVANLLLALQSRGLAAIPQGAIAIYSDFVRSFLELTDDRMVVCAVSFGFGDDSDPANGFRTERAELSDVLHHVER